MSFELSKILWWLVEPITIAFVALCAGAALLWTAHARAGKAIISTVIAVQLVFAVLPLGQWLNVTLENRFPPPHLPPDIDGIIVLGGGLDQFISKARGQVTMGGAATRMLVVADLTRLYPEARVVFTGGSGTVGRQDVKEADIARQVFSSLGLDTSRFEFEDQARNTYENAVFSKNMVQPRPGEIWLLVTSAKHMPRAVGTFRQAGWSVIAFPVDYHTEGDYEIPPSFHIGGLGNFTAALKEWAGLAAYKVLGRSDSWFPGPADETMRSAARRSIGWEVEAEIEDWGAMGDPADGNEIDARRGDVADSLARNPT